LPLPVSSGEFWLVHKTGSFLKLTNDGKVSINGNAEIDITAPIINIGSTTGSSAVSIGDLVSALTGVMNDVAISVYNSHTHNQAGGGITAVPNQLLDSTALTQNLKAN